MHKKSSSLILRAFSLALIFTAAFLLVCGALLFARSTASRVYAAPIPPPAGYPKLSLSTKSVQPELAPTGGATLNYQIKVLNTGATAAAGATLVDKIPANTTYQGDAQASSGTTNVTADKLTWSGDVGFDSSVVVSFSVKVDAAFAGTITNTAVISQAQIAHPVSVTAKTVVTDQPIFTIQKTGSPKKPGPGKPLTYALKVTNIGQPASSLAATVSDQLPQHTTFLKAGSGGLANQGSVSWHPTLDLDTGASSVFTYSVTVADVPSGTVLTNDHYQVSSTPTGVAYGQPYTLTVVDPQFFISKVTWPDPPGSNREMTYTLTVLNRGSLATNLVVSDTLPSGVDYIGGGSLVQNKVVRWTLPQLDTGQKADFSFTVSVGDVAEVPIVNNDYEVCSAERVCQSGAPLTSLVKGPTFAANLMLDPIAKKPGGGNSPVTPTLVLENLGPGTALDASAILYFQRISVQESDLQQDPSLGSFSPGPDCVVNGVKCVSYRWVGNLAAGQAVTLSTSTGQNSIIGAPNTHYTTTVVMTDQLGSFTTAPFTATVFGVVTHNANLIPSKTAPPVIGPGQVMTYSMKVFNSGLSTDTSAAPTLTDTIPASTTLVTVSDGGTSSAIGDRTVVSWDLPALSTGESLYRSFSVRTDPDLVSGTQIINKDYWTRWFSGTELTSNIGEPFTTTVREVGLIDSFKVVTPTLARPGPGNVLTYTLHVVNSSPAPLYGVSLSDILPWEHSTYQRDAVASAGDVISDIVSLGWTGDVMPNSQQLITFSVLVDSDFSGVLTNTATITHTSLRAPVKISALAYITDQPVLALSKSASPNPVDLGGELLYTLHVQNLGQQATVLVLTDTVPANTSFVVGSATAGGELVGDQVHWTFPLIEPGETRNFSFGVKVLEGTGVLNDRYRVSSAEGASASGAPVYTPLNRRFIFLPLLR